METSASMKRSRLAACCCGSAPAARMRTVKGWLWKVLPSIETVAAPMVKVPGWLGTRTKRWLMLADIWPLTSWTWVDWPRG